MEFRQDAMIYAFFDGDNVGDKIEILLLDGDLEKARALSESIKVSLTGIEQYLSGRFEIILSGGDDLLVRFEDSEDILTIVAWVRSKFAQETGLTMSCGIGRTIADSIYQLGLAKLYGKNGVRGRSHGE